MGSWAQSLALWWSSGHVFTPIMLGVSLALYALVGERLWSLAMVRRVQGGSGTHGQPRVGDLTRGFSLIRAGTIALPLLGLLGTVSGMVGTFASLSTRGQSSLSQGAGAGISEALVSTQYGILLAVPGMIALWYLRERAELIARRASAAAATGAQP